MEYLGDPRLTFLKTPVSRGPSNCWSKAPLFSPTASSVVLSYTGTVNALSLNDRASEAPSPSSASLARLEDLGGAFAVWFVDGIYVSRERA